MRRVSFPSRNSARWASRAARSQLRPGGASGTLPPPREAGFRLRTAPRGYALIVMLIAITVLLISLSAALPSIYQESERQKEEELIFRGEQYARAVYLFQRQFQRYPTSVKELLHTNNLSFLRHAWPDPMSPDGKWRFIHATANGILVDSITARTTQPAPLGGHASTLENGMAGGGMGLGNQPGQTSASTSGGQAGEPGQAGQTAEGARPKPPGCEKKGKEDLTSSFFGNSNQLQGAFIVGVASCSDRQSIRIWNHKDHYDEWEFLGVGYIPGEATGFPGGGSAAPPTSQPGSNGFGIGNSPGGAATSPATPNSAAFPPDQLPGP